MRILTTEGRLDAFRSQELASAWEGIPGKSGEKVVLDLSRVDYLSSGGIRLLVTLQKRCAASGGRFALAGARGYCREVLRVAGLESAFEAFASVEEAGRAWSAGEDWEAVAGGRVRPATGRDAGAAGGGGGIEVLGDINDVLAARITPAHVRKKRFFAKAYSLGLGGMAPSVEEVMPLMGEMITIGGTMVWLPTDGNDTPDFLIPKADSETVTILTGFNASIAGPFDEYLEFEAGSPAGATMNEIYRALFDRAKATRRDFRGAIGLAMRAQVGEVYGCGVVRSPIATQAPANGKWITDPSNFAEWFEVNTEPRHRHLTGLICGVGLDLDADLSGYNARYLNATFYLNPANRGGAREQLHNHGVFFNQIPFPEEPGAHLEDEIARVVEEGDFRDMRHLLDKTRVTRALLGVVYVQDFRPEEA